MNAQQTLALRNGSLTYGFTALAQAGVFVLALLLVLWSGDAAAQTAETPPAASAISEDAYDALGGGVSADAYDYEALAQDGVMVTEAREGLLGLLAFLRQEALATPEMLSAIRQTLDGHAPVGEDWTYFAELIGQTALLLLASMLAVILFIGLPFLRPWFIRQKRPNPQGVDEKLPLLLLRGSLGFGGILLSMVVAAIAGRLVFGPPPNDAATDAILLTFAAYLAVRLMVISWRVILSPYLCEYRIPAFSDWAARKLFVWLALTGAVTIILQFGVLWLATLDLEKRYHALFMISVAAVGVVLNTLMVLFNGRAVSRAIRGGREWNEATWPARWAGILWGPALILYALGAWGVMTFNMLNQQPPGPPLIVSLYVIFLTVIVVYAFSAFLIQRFFVSRRIRLANASPEAPAEVYKPLGEIGGGDGSDDGDSDEEGAVRMAPEAARTRPYSGGMRTYEDLARRIASVIAVSAGLWALHGLWADRALMVNAPWISQVVDVGMTVFLGYILYHSMRIWIDQKSEEEGVFDAPNGPLEGEGGGAGASRLATLLPLFRNFILVLITITVGLIIALELGVNVAPLFAGAGIIGLAIGFGSQTLVRDILSGAFYLWDDAFRRGEYVDLGFVKGIVEKISMRSFQLRHHLGYLHTVPFGEIQYLTNYSRDWVIMKLPLRLTYDTDAEAVRKKIKKLGEELLKHPVYGERFLQPLKSQGVIQMEDSAMIMRVKFMTRPGEQWELRKVVYAQIRDLFAREGIRFAHREVTVRIADGDGSNLTPEQKQAVAGAVRPTLDPEGEAGADALAESR